MTPNDPTMTLRLVERAQLGDRAAFDEVFGRYYDRALRHVRRRVGPKLRRDLDSRDILHESLTVAMRKFSEFDMRDPASLIRWLRAIVENQIRDKVIWQNAQCRSRSQEVEIDDPRVDLGEEGVGSRQTPLDELTRRERHQSVDDHLDGIAPHYRELIVARDFDGLSWQEIAELTGRPSADAARMMYHKALIELGQAVRRGRTTGSVSESEDRPSDD